MAEILTSLEPSKTTFEQINEKHVHVLCPHEDKMFIKNPIDHYFY